MLWLREMAPKRKAAIAASAPKRSKTEAAPNPGQLVAAISAVLLPPCSSAGLPVPALIRIVADYATPFTSEPRLFLGEIQEHTRRLYRNPWNTASFLVDMWRLYGNPPAYIDIEERAVETGSPMLPRPTSSGVEMAAPPTAACLQATAPPPTAASLQPTAPTSNSSSPPATTPGANLDAPQPTWSSPEGAIRSAVEACCPDPLSPGEFFVSAKSGFGCYCRGIWRRIVLMDSSLNVVPVPECATRHCMTASSCGNWVYVAGGQRGLSQLDLIDVSISTSVIHRNRSLSSLALVWDRARVVPRDSALYVLTGARGKPGKNRPGSALYRCSIGGAAGDWKAERIDARSGSTCSKAVIANGSGDRPVQSASAGAETLFTSAAAGYRGRNGRFRMVSEHVWSTQLRFVSMDCIADSGLVLLGGYVGGMCVVDPVTGKDENLFTPPEHERATLSLLVDERSRSVLYTDGDSVYSLRMPPHLFPLEACPCCVPKPS